MDNDAVNLAQLLDSEYIKNVLNSVTGLIPATLFVLTPAGDIFATAGDIDLPQEIIQQITQAPDQKPVDPAMAYAHAPITVMDDHIGDVVGLSFETTSPLLSAVELIQQYITDQVGKEYELDRMTSELLNKYEELSMLYELSQDLGVLFDIPTICNIALERVLELVKAQKAFIGLMDDDNKNLTVIAACNMPNFPGWKIPVGEGVSGRVAATGRQILLNPQDVIPSDTIDRWVMDEAILSVPLVLPADHPHGEDQILGVISLTGKTAGDMFTAGDAQLVTTIMIQVTVAIHNSRLIKAVRNAERMKQEVEIASRIQQSLLPKNPPQLPGIALTGQCLSTTNVGGDYYDILTDEEGRLVLLIADASGHSIASALMMAMARSILRHEIGLGRPLNEILSNTNTAMFDDLIEAEMFISLFCARFDPPTRQLTFANAGHNPPLLQRATNGKAITLNNDGLILGLVENAAYQVKTITLNPGDTLVLYTDGVIEARNPTGKQFGKKYLQKLLSKNCQLPPLELQEHIYKAVHQHTQDTTLQDDVTLLILKVQTD